MMKLIAIYGGMFECAKSPPVLFIVKFWNDTYGKTDANIVVVPFAVIQ